MESSKEELMQSAEYKNCVNSNYDMLVEAEMKLREIKKQILNIEHDAVCVKDMVEKENYVRDDLIDEVICGLTSETQEKFLETGITAIDARITGLRRGQVYHLLSENNSGSNGIAYNIISRVLKRGGNVLFIAKRYSVKEHLKKLLCLDAGVSTFSNIHVYSAEEKGKLFKVSNEYKENKLTMYPAYDESIFGIKKMCLEAKCELIVIDDYVSMCTEGVKLAEVKRNLRQIACECKCPVLVLDAYSKNICNMVESYAKTRDIIDAFDRENPGICNAWIIRHDDYFKKEKTGKVEILAIGNRNRTFKILRINQDWETRSIS